MVTGMGMGYLFHTGEILACLHTGWNDPAEMTTQDKVGDAQPFL